VVLAPHHRAGVDSGMRVASLVALSLVVAAVLSSSSCLVWRNQWRHSKVVQTAKDVSYTATDDGNDKHRLDIYAPGGAQGVPVVVFVHGGFWREGDRNYYKNIVGLYGNFGTALADNDVVTVIPSYRLFPEVQTVDAMLDDVAAALAWTRDHIAVHGGDPNKIILAGHSAGGHLVALLAAQPDALKKRGVDPSVVKGVVALSGVHDVVYATDNATKEEDRTTLWKPLFADRGRAESPATYFGDAMPKTLFVIGENDYKSCLHDYREAEKSLAGNVGKNAFFKFIPGATHEDIVLLVGTAEDEVGPAVAAFAWFATG